MNINKYLLFVFFLISILLFRGCYCDDDEVPITVILDQPLNGATVNTNYVNLEWSCPSAVGQTESNIFLDTFEAAHIFDYSSLIDSVENQYHYRIDSLEPSTTYYWQIEFWADNGYDVSYIHHFTTASEFSPIGTINNITPDSGATETGTTPELVWQCYNPESEAMSYDVFFGTTSSPPLVSNHQADTNYWPGTLELDQIYYWKVISYNAANEPTVGPLWEFTTTTITPGTLYAPNPADEAVAINTNISIWWHIHNPGELIYSYDLYLGTTTDPEKIADDLEKNITNVGPLDHETTYYWRVVAFTSPTDSTIGPLWSFTTLSPTYGVYAKIILNSRLLQDIFANDEITVRFDSSFAPDEPIDTLVADSVKVNGNLMSYSAYNGNYSYMEDPSLRWIPNSGNFLFTIYGNSIVPEFSFQTEFLACSPRITSPENMATVSFAGFTVTWSDLCSGNVFLTMIQSGDTTDVWVNTYNNGSYEFVPSDLSSLVGNPGFYDLTIIFEKIDTIAVSGYDSRSIALKRSSHSIAIYLE